MNAFAPSDPGVNIAADDCFVVVDLAASTKLAPDPSLVAGLSQTIAELGHWEVIWDLRGNGRALYDDAIDAYRAGADLQTKRPTVLIPPDREVKIDEFSTEEILRWAPPPLQPKLLKTRAKPLSTIPLDLTPFSENWTGDEPDPSSPLTRADLAKLERDRFIEREHNRHDFEAAVALGIVANRTDDELADAEENLFAAINIEQAQMSLTGWDQHALRELEAGIQAQRKELLEAFLSRIASNSLLAQVALLNDDGRIRVIPLHANALHGVDCGTEMLAVRPARQGATAQWGQFKDAIFELEELINGVKVSEAEIEAVLRRNPLFLRGLNYAHAYHQVVLPMDDGKSLRPDIIAEPIASEWADIIDLKLPTEPIFVGYGDRAHLSQAIARAASQLRQYARWFDDRTVSQRVEDRYGFRCLKPRQVVIIGRDPKQFSEAQREAARSAYPDLEIVTYDRLLRVAREQLLF